MLSKRLSKPLIVAAACCALWAREARAAVFDLDLTGIVANGGYSSQEIGATHYDQWALSLSGLDALSAITVAEGDVINATITLDQAFTIPGSVQLTSFGFFTGGDGFPDVDTETSGTTSLFLGGLPVTVRPGGSLTHAQLNNSVSFFPPDNGPITFDSVFSSFTVVGLGGQTASLDYSGITYTLFSPATGAAAPEPAGWALMLLGFGGLGAMLRRRRGWAAA